MKKKCYLTIKHFSTLFFNVYYSTIGENDYLFIFLLLHDERVFTSYLFPSLSFSSFLISCFKHTSVFLHECHLDPRIANISFDNFTGSVYIVDRNLHDENHSESMLTSPRTNGVDNFVPSHHLALITQPVLGARSRLRKNPTNIIVQTSTKAKIDSMTNTHRSSYNDSPPLILPINRVKKKNILEKKIVLSYLDRSITISKENQFQ